jgi:hypothetical protein
MGIRVSRWQQWALESFIVLAAREELLVGCTTENSRQLLFFGNALPGIMAADGRGLAHLAGGRSISRLDAYGHEGAEEALADLVDEWGHRGRPGVAGLSVEVSYGRSRQEGWRIKRRGSSVISFDY